jgi:hypothetical protein
VDPVLDQQSVEAVPWQAGVNRCELSAEIGVRRLRVHQAEPTEHATQVGVDDGDRSAGEGEDSVSRLRTDLWQREQRSTRVR